MAVRGGFEPPVQFPVRQFSKLVVSATHPPHRDCAILLLPSFLSGCKYKYFCIHSKQLKKILEAFLILIARFNFVALQAVVDEIVVLLTHNHWIGF